MTQRTEGFDKDETIAGVEERVKARFPDAEPAVVHDEAVAAVEKFADAPVKDFVDIIAEREARARVEDATTEA
ncbi:three-helix bundle dimerization domain-containing protein [Microbacterium sp. LMI1-1-1.1]|uniref:three-helix bundle dimerization domain-containing protein n=1 Tax=Microbacterium sp. LMI1-1-1.1 TaxID=3135223 RepID=UPI003466489A